ncbi:Spy/CpxP family protein refolding chaperone [Gracilimonas sp.]|uniref:Spy/CpxP family protein refolding chaperone n=1 Tax=Gracilimonas sp. TaxID=1974203 RepID=UPI0028725F2F|nr:Spy/CpxP family protein refolding chaperone [Gracilimonas sp.]
MEVSKKYKWALGGLIVMVLLNAATLFTIWINKPDVRNWRNADDRDRNPAQHFMKERLDLTDAQSDSVESLRHAHFSEVRQNRDSLNKYRQAYLEFIMSDESGNKAKKDSLLNLITGQYHQIESAMYQHMAEMKEVLNSEQQQKFKKVLKNTVFRNQHDNREHRERMHR